MSDCRAIERNLKMALRPDTRSSSADMKKERAVLRCGDVKLEHRI